jgi:hypothetical protein
MPGNQESQPSIINDDETELAAKGWIGMNDENLLIKIDVTDDHHLNDKEQAEVWKGDAIQIGIDPEGQGAGEMPIETPGMVESDDAGLGFGIGKNGAEGFAWFLGSNWVSVSVDKSIYKITRNEKKKLTTYELSIPWKTLKTKPGVHPHMGIAIQVNDNDPERKDQNRLYWGKGAGGASTPGLFEKLAYSHPQSPLVHAYKSDQVAWTVGDQGEMCFTMASPENYELNVMCNGKNLTLTIPGSANLTANRYSVKLIVKDLKKPVSFEASLLSANNKKVLNEKVSIIIPDLTVNDFFHRIDSLIAVPNNHPLFERHLNSLKALVMGEWGKMNMYKSNPRAVRETFTFIYNINEGLKGDACKWGSYLT